MRYGEPAAWRRFLEERGLDPALATAWSRFARSSIRLMPSTFDEDGTLPGSSKLGGLPDLPLGVAWPTRAPYRYPKEGCEFLPPVAWEPRPLSFLAQINLADVAVAGSDLPLPDAGLLLFFYDTETQPWGYDPLDAPGARLLFVKAGTTTRRQLDPADRSSRVRPLQLLPSEGLPGWAWLQAEHEDDPRYCHDALYEELQKLSDEDEQEISFGGHVFGGWPCVIQSPMELECEMLRRGLYAGDPEGYADPRMAGVRRGAKDWRLLLQLGSDDELHWMWGDMGSLYFWCREDDIAQEAFERAWAILQCT
ncbi:MAG: YwqG family protein [Pseudomonadota bacterium]